MLTLLPLNPDPEAKKFQKPSRWDAYHTTHLDHDQPEWEIIEELERNYRQNRRLILL